LRSIEAQVVRVPALDLVVPFLAGEEMRTEVSAKFRRDRVERELAAAGLRLTEWWTDPAGDFALSLSVRA
jgi:L-histidine Nalpha-methyltransferase